MAKTLYRRYLLIPFNIIKYFWAGFDLFNFVKLSGSRSVIYGDIASANHTIFKAMRHKAENQFFSYTKILITNSVLYPILWTNGKQV